MRRIAVLVLGALVLAACGARLSEDQQAALSTNGGGGATAGQSGGGGGATIDDGTATITTDDVPLTDGGGDGATSAGGSDPAAGGSDPAAGGGGADPAAPAGGGDPAAGDGGAAAETGSSCKGGGASDTGVTDKEIKLGNVSTISGPIPGFGQTGVNAVKAYVNFVNATGGVCGRKLVLVTADDRLQSGTNKSETDKLKGQVLGFAGGTSVVDDGAAQSINGTNVGYTGLAISEAMIRAANNFPTVPIDLQDGGNGALEIFKYLKQVEGVTKGGLVWPAQASAKARIGGYKKDMERAGITIALEVEVAVTETNYSGVAANIEGAGVDVLITTLEISGMSNLAKAMSQNGYFPKVPFYGAQAYGRGFLKQAGAAAEPTVLGLAYTILEDAGSVPPVNDFLTWYQRTNPGSDIDFFAIEAWIAADLYVSALRKVSGPPTRDKVLASLKTFTNYDAKGFIAPINPAGKKGASCFMIAKVKAGKWFRAHPSKPGFDCSFA